MLPHQLQQPHQNHQMPVLRNPPTTPPTSQPSARFANGHNHNNQSPLLPLPTIPQFSPMGPLPPAPPLPPNFGPQLQLSRISRTPQRSIVQVKAYGLIHEGEFKYIKNGPTFSVLDSVELFNPILLPDGIRIQASSMRFNIREIQDFQVIRKDSRRKSSSSGGEKKKNKKPEIDPDQPVQLHLTTLVINTASQLKMFAQIIYDIDVCGVSLEGENVSRDGKVSWILLGVKKTLVPLDIISLTRREVPNVWDTLKKAVFENKKVVKIFHDCRPAADYLFHKHGIKMVNVFDTQVADAFIERSSTGFHPAELRSLADVLQVYNARIPSEEIEFLRKHDRVEDYKASSPWMVRPLPEPQYLKYGAIKVKHLVPLRDNVVKKMMEKFYKGVTAQVEIYSRNSTESSVQIQNPLAMPAHLEAILDEESSGSIAGSG